MNTPMKKIFTLLILAASAITAFAQSPAVGDEFMENGVKYEVTSIKSGEEHVCVQVQEWTDAILVIPDSVEYGGKKWQVYNIINNAFKDNTFITSVDLQCEELWSSAFENCTNLTTIILREGVQKINEDAFSNVGATSLHLPKSLNKLDANNGTPFSNNKFTAITLEEGNTYFVVGEDGAIYNTEKTILMAYPYAFAKPFSEVPEGIETILENTFAYCKNMADTVILPTTLERAVSAFDCTNIKCAIVNNYVHGTAFRNINTLENVILGKNVEKICFGFFSGCDAIKNVYVLAESMPEWYNPGGSYSDFPFSATALANAKLYVPCGQSDAYKASTESWGKFEAANIVDTLFYDVTVAADKGNCKVEKTSECNELKLTVTPSSGFKFVNWDNGETANPLTLTVTQDTALKANFAEIISAIEATVAYPKAGQEAAANVALDWTGDKLAGGYTVFSEDGITNINTEILAPSTTYMLQISFSPREGFIFADEVAITVNGATVSDKYIANENQQTIRLLFTTAATAMDKVQSDKVQCTKMLRDGQLYLMYNGQMYNVQGQMEEINQYNP